jgi:hypothetical protein
VNFAPPASGSGRRDGDSGVGSGTGNTSSSGSFGSRG